MPMDLDLECDVLIVGGGINGCGIAADAASRGLKVILCEQCDLASGTSSASTNLIHGGLRYLELFEFALVRKALREREILHHNCPHLVTALPFVLAINNNTRSRFWLRLGLFVYDHLAKISFPKTKTLTRKSNTDYFKKLIPEINKGFMYYDAQTMDSRLAVLNALQAKKFGATILTRTRFVKTQRKKNYWLSKLSNKTNNYLIKSSLLVNVTGPYTEQVSNNIGIALPTKLSLIQGSHIVINKLYSGDYAYLLQNEDGRVVFTIPYNNDYTLIGTTETKVTSPKASDCVTEDELAYMFKVIKKYFLVHLSKKDIIHTYTGIRPLIEDPTAESTNTISRDYKIINNFKDAPYTCILGGKLTTYRVLAKECVDSWRSIFTKLPKCKTQNLKLPGSDFKTLKILEKTIKNQFSFLSP